MTDPKPATDIQEIVKRILAGEDVTLDPRQRMALDRVPMPEEDPERRSHSFEEVNLGFTEHLAMLEAERCLQCKNPKCIDGCPVRVNIPRFIDHLRRGDMAAAAGSLLDDNALPCVTGRVCPQETQCEGLCLRGKKGAPVAIGSLERYVADWAGTHPEALAHATPAPLDKSVAIVGSGPAGLTAAGELAKAGYRVTVFEAFHAAGGVLIYGIPEFRLPNDIVEREVARLVDGGVTIETNAIIGKTYTLAELRERFDAVFLAVGAGLPVFMDDPGREPQGRLLGERVPHPRQPHGRLGRRQRHPRAARAASGRGGRRERRDGCRSDRPPPRRCRGDDRLPPGSRRAARPR